MPGPVETKHTQFGDIKGLFFSAFREGSKYLHEMIQCISESKVKSMGLSSGRRCSENELGLIVGQIQRMLSDTCVRA